MKRIDFAMVALAIIALTTMVGCGGSTDNPRYVGIAISGVKQTTASIPLGADGLTAEQRNVKERIKQDNAPGAIKHLYVFSTMSGQCLLYSTVREKVTSSGKRLSPTSVVAGRYGADRSWSYGVPISVNGDTQHTTELVQDDGTYGSSIEYLYWFDSKGVYHQHYLAGGQIVHISTEPMPVKNVIVNLEAKPEK